jgi:cytochrome b561
MNIFQLRFINIGLFFLLIFSSGYWLHHSGKPYGAILFNAHKLIGFGLFVLLVIRVFQLNRTTPLSAVAWIACAVAAVFFIATIVFGGLVSTGNPMPIFVTLAHKFLPYLTLLSTGLSLYLLLGQQVRLAT